MGIVIIGGESQEAYAEQLKILRTKLNKHSITGILQNPNSFPIGSIVVQAEFYKDGNLVGVRDFGYSTKDELKPGEKSPFKIPDTGKPFPKTAFNVTAEGTDFTNMVEVSGDEMITQIEQYGKALENLPKEVNIDVTQSQNGTILSQNKTIVYQNGTIANATR